MPCTYSSAIQRLIAVWVENVITDESYSHRVTLADVLSARNIEVVQRYDLLRSHDLDLQLESLRQSIGETARNQALIRAWQTSRTGQVQ